MPFTTIFKSSLTTKSQRYLLYCQDDAAALVLCTCRYHHAGAVIPCVLFALTFNMYIFRSSSLFCMGSTILITSAEVDHKKDVLGAERSTLSKCPRFHHQDISLIGYFNQFLDIFLFYLQYLVCLSLLCFKPQPHHPTINCGASTFAIGWTLAF